MSVGMESSASVRIEFYHALLWQRNADIQGLSLIPTPALKLLKSLKVMRSVFSDFLLIKNAEKSLFQLLTFSFLRDKLCGHSVLGNGIPRSIDKSARLQHCHLELENIG